MTLDASGNLGLGTTSISGAANTNLQVKNSGSASLRVTGGSGTGFDVLQDSGGVTYLWNRDNAAVSFATNATERMRIDSSGNVGIGATSPRNSSRVTIDGTNDATSKISLYRSDTGSALQVGSNYIGTWSNSVFEFYQNATERMRIDSSGNLLVGTTAAPTGSTGGSGFIVESVGRRTLKIATTTTGGAGLAEFINPNGVVGTISVSGSTTTYGTSSDYRLKENIAPMTGALAVVSALKPCTYTWKADGSDGQGFIAHELAEVVPDAVTGEKDAVNEDGSIKSQSIDTSFLVATLTAAIQELKAEVDALKAQINQ
jgi:hypothetical protein